MAEVPLARVGQAEAIEVVWRPFELRPDGVPLPDQAYIDKHWTQSVYPLSQELGLLMRKPTVRPRTRLAHEAAEFARRADKQGAMAEALFEAYFQENRDIGRVEVLCDVGLSVGLDPVELREALQQRTLQEAVEGELDLAARYRISAVPSFIVGNRFLVRGLVPEEHLLKAVRMCKGEGLIDLK